MFNDEIKQYYDTLSPSEEIRQKLLFRLTQQRRKSLFNKLVWEIVSSAAVCALVAFGINVFMMSRAAKKGGAFIATVLNKPNGYVTAAILFTLLCGLFIALYMKKSSEYKK